MTYRQPDYQLHTLPRNPEFEARRIARLSKALVAILEESTSNSALSIGKAEANLREELIDNLMRMRPCALGTDGEWLPYDKTDL